MRDLFTRVGEVEEKADDVRETREEEDLEAL